MIRQAKALLLAGILALGAGNVWGQQIVPGGGSGGGAPTGAAGGDLGGTYPNPTVVAGADIIDSHLGKVTLTQPATTSILTILNNKTLTVNNTLALSGTDSTTMTFPSTSATVARTDAAQSFTGLQTFGAGLTVSSGQTNLSGTVVNGGQAISFNGFGKIGGISGGTQLQDSSGNTSFSVKNGAGWLTNYTVATLPASPPDGALAFITDATLTAITGLGLAPTGSGSNKVVVYGAGGGWLIL